MEFWLVSVPPDRANKDAYTALDEGTKGLSVNYRFTIPDLKVGTLDMLVGLSDDLTKLDQFGESVTRKVAHYLGEVLEEERDKLHENLMANGMDLSHYLQRFQWDVAKYPIKQQLRNIADLISKQISQIDSDLKTKSGMYNSIKGQLQQLGRKSAGSLITRSIGELVNKEDFVLDSEYLTTLLVVVPKSAYDDWRKKYEQLTAMVVPRSTKLVYEDNENGLWTVTMFSRAADEYKHKCRENRFIVRDFKYDEEELMASKNEMMKLQADKKKQFGPLVRWLKVNFSESFSAWIHIKALRVFVESVLRYGVPVDFSIAVMQPHKKSAKKLKDLLQSMYMHLDTASQNTSKAQDQMDMPGLSMMQAEYYPYVIVKIDANVEKRH